MNGYPIRQPWGVVCRDKIRKSVTLDNSAGGRKRTQKYIAGALYAVALTIKAFVRSNMVSPELIKSSENLIRSLCQDKDGWEFSESEPLKDDPWGADTLLIFNREDYVVCYVGVRSGNPLYVLQRIE